MSGIGSQPYDAVLLRTGNMSISCEHSEDNRRGPVDIVTAPTFIGIPHKKFRAILDELPVFLWVHDEHYTVVHANSTFRARYGDCIGKPCHRCIMKLDHVCSCCISDQVMESCSARKCSGCSCEGAATNTQTFHRPYTRKDGSKYVLKSTIVMDNLYKSLDDLEDTYGSKAEDTSRAYWSICAWCKKVKDDSGSWIEFESFLGHYFNITISHGICPGCAEKFFSSEKAH